MNLFKNGATYVAGASLCLLLTACGKRPPIITGLGVNPIYHESGDVSVSIQAELGLQGMNLPIVELPVNHPRLGYEIGIVSMAGRNLGVVINLSAILDLQTLQGTLPNGTSVPFVNANEVVIIPIEKAGVELYVSFSQGQIIVGATVAIKQFDGIGASVGNLNLLPMFSIQGIQGAAGTYHSRTAGQNGIALFVNASSVIDSLKKDELIQESGQKSFESLGQNSIYGDVPSARTEAKIGKYLQKLSNRKEVLDIQ